LDDQRIGLAFSIFALGYALGQIPSGYLADRLGPRAMLAAIVALWSLLTAATGWVTGFAQLLAVRFLFGVAEAGAFPGSARAFYNWLPSSEHGRANGIVFCGSRLGAALAFPLMAWLLTLGDWRQTFALLAWPGLLWALAWFVLFRNHPATKVESTRRTNEGTPLRTLLRQAPLWRAMLQYFGANFTTFLCLSWMNPYLKQRYQLSSADAAFYTMIPLLIAAGVQWATGTLVDRLYRTEPQVSRSRPAMLGFALSAVGALLIPLAPTPALAAAAFAVAAFGAEMTISPSWAFCLDIGGRHSGAVSGTMNMAGNLGSFVSANAFPWLAGMTGDATAYFALVAALNLTGVWCWRGMKSLSPNR
jgi:ACS family glucarate transporter-like MFS transporter